MSLDFAWMKQEHRTYGHDLWVVHPEMGGGDHTQTAIDNVCRDLNCPLIGTKPYERQENSRDLTIWRVTQRDVESFVGSPIKREEFFGSYILALEAANSWKGYGVDKDIKIETIIVKVS